MEGCGESVELLTEVSRSSCARTVEPAGAAIEARGPIDGRASPSACRQPLVDIAVMATRYRGSARDTLVLEISIRGSLNRGLDKLVSNAISPFRKRIGRIAGQECLIQQYVLHDCADLQKLPVGCCMESAANDSSEPWARSEAAQIRIQICKIAISHVSKKTAGHQGLPLLNFEIDVVGFDSIGLVVRVT